MKNILYFYCIFFTLFSCKKKNLSTQFSDSPIIGKATIDVIEMEPPVDGESLATNFFHIQAENIDHYFFAALYVTKPEKADYVQFFICSEENQKACSPTMEKPGEFLTSPHYYPDAPYGKNIAYARSCVRPERALNPEKLCGGWAEAYYEQPINDPNLRKFLSEAYHLDPKPACNEIREFLRKYNTDYKNNQKTNKADDVAKNNFNLMVQNLLNLSEDLHCNIVMTNHEDPEIWPWVLIAMGSASYVASATSLYYSLTRETGKVDEFKTDTSSIKKPELTDRSGVALPDQNEKNRKVEETKALTQKDLEALMAEANAKEDKIGDYLRQRHKLEEQIKDLQNQITGIKKQDMDEKNQALEEKRKLLTQKQQELADEIERNKKIVTELEAQNTALKQRRTQLTKDLGEFAADQKKAGSDKERADAAARLEIEKAQIEKDLKTAQEGLAQKRAAQTALDDQQRKLAAEVSSLETQVSAATKEARAAQATVEKAQRELDAETRRLADTQARIERETQDLDAEKKRIADQFIALKASLAGEKQKADAKQAAQQALYEKEAELKSTQEALTRAEQQATLFHSQLLRKQQEMQDKNIEKTNLEVGREAGIRLNEEQKAANKAEIDEIITEFALNYSETYISKLKTKFTRQYTPLESNLGFITKDSHRSGFYIVNYGTRRSDPTIDIVTNKIDKIKASEIIKQREILFNPKKNNVEVAEINQYRKLLTPEELTRYFISQLLTPPIKLEGKTLLDVILEDQKITPSKILKFLKKKYPGSIPVNGHYLFGEFVGSTLPDEDVSMGLDRETKRKLEVLQNKLRPTEDFNARIKILEDDISSLQKEVIELTNKNKEATDNALAKRHTMEDLQRELALLRTAYSALEQPDEAAIRALLEQNKQATDAAEKKRLELEQRKKALTQAQSNLDAKKQALEQQKAYLTGKQQALAELNSQLAEQKRTQVALQEKITQAQSRLKEAQAEVSKQEKLLAEKKRAITDQNARNTDDLTRAQQELAQRQAALDKRKQELAVAEQDLNKKIKEEDAIFEKNRAALTQNIEELEKSVISAESEAKTLREKFGQEQDVSKQIAELSRQSAELEAKYKEEKSELEQKIAQERTALEQKNREQIKQIQAEYDEALAKAKKAQAAIDTENARKIGEYNQKVTSLTAKQKAQYDADTAFTRSENRKALTAKFGTVATAALGTALIAVGINELHDSAGLQLSGDKTDQLIEDLKKPAAKILELKKRHDELMEEAFKYRRSLDE